MSRCLSPIPPNPPLEYRTDITCADLDLGAVVPEVPSNCVCPDNILDYPIGNFEFFYDRFWYVGGPSVFYKRQYLVSLLVNKDGLHYSQVFIHSEGECQLARRRRIEVQVLNLPGLQKIACVDYDQNGDIITTHYDVDMSSIFGDGQEHRITIAIYDAPLNELGTRVYVDAQQVGDVTRPWDELSDFVKLKVSGGVDGAFVPFAMWDYQQSIEQCLSSGIYNGFGGCARLDQREAFYWDRNRTDLNVELYNNDRVAVPKEGASTRRNTYLLHPVFSGRVYWEMHRSRTGTCRADGDSAYGGVDNQIVLADNMPGLVTGSWGLRDAGNQLWANGVLLQPDITFSLLQCFCFDAQLGRLWIGFDTNSPPGTRQWFGGGEPAAGALSWDVLPPSTDMRIVFHFFESIGAVYVNSSEKSCHFPAPETFDYLR